MPVHTVQSITADPCASYWLKDACRALMHRDPVDALSDAEALLKAMRKRWADQRKADARANAAFDESERRADRFYSRIDSE